MVVETTLSIQYIYMIIYVYAHIFTSRNCLSETRFRLFRDGTIHGFNTFQPLVSSPQPTIDLVPPGWEAGHTECLSQSNLSGVSGC